MQLEQFRQLLHEEGNGCLPFLHSWGLRDPDRGRRNLILIDQHFCELEKVLRETSQTHFLGPTSQTDNTLNTLNAVPRNLQDLVGPLSRFLPRCPDPDMALNNLERFLANPFGAVHLPTLLEHRARTLEVVLQLFSTSQPFSDLLAQHPEHLDMLRGPRGLVHRSPQLAELRDELQTEVESTYEDSAVLRAFRRYRLRHLLRIGTNDVIRDRPLEEITRDISQVAEAALGIALQTAQRNVERRFGRPFVLETEEPATCVILALGKLGGAELNYSSDLDLMFVYSDEGSTRGNRTPVIGNDDFFSRVITEILRLLSSHSDRGPGYRIDLRLRPEGQRGPLARSLASTLAYYDTAGRTWERQALIKVRPVAGDLALGQRFLEGIEPFVYRKYLTFAEINEIKALKRLIEQKASRAGVSDTEVKTGHGGIRDIEFTIQFLQLLNGGDLPQIRQRGTLPALHALEEARCLTHQEYLVLEDAYRFLRRTEHRLQLLFDLQTHRLPERSEELHRLALRMGYSDSAISSTTTTANSSESAESAESANATHSPTPRSRTVRRKSIVGNTQPIEPTGLRPQAPRPDESAPAPTSTPPDPSAAFLRDYRDKTEPTRRILEHLLHQTFAGGGSSEDSAEPESDLLLDPDPDPETIRSVLGRYRINDVEAAYKNLVQLATESVPFLSHRRCRQFLASIAPNLLRAVADTPDPDLALNNLEKVTGSLGCKSILWEAFSFNPPSLRLYVDLCAWSEFLSEILINNPGMIDELLDSLVLNQPRSAEDLQAELAELCRGAMDLTSLEPIWHSFQDKELLRIGVRDILGKDSTRETSTALSDLAEVLLAQVTSAQNPPLVKRFGIPTLAEGERAGSPARFVILALGKLGSREMSYHSDLDLLMLYEGDGRTTPPPHASRFDRYEVTDNFHYFTEFAQRVIRATSQLGPMGRLYPIDMRLRPTGKSGSLVLPLGEFRRYFAQSETAPAQLWERQALTRARVVVGEEEFAEAVSAALSEAVYGLAWRPALAVEVQTMREKLEAKCSVRDLKRGFGGLADIEFLVQLLQLEYGRNSPLLRTPNTWEALSALRQVGLLNEGEYNVLEQGYNFLLRVQGRLRIVHNRILNVLPDALDELEKLARRLGFVGLESGPAFLAEFERHTTRLRELFLKRMAQERGL